VVRKTLIIQVDRGAREGASAQLHRLWYHGLTLPYLAALFGERCEVEILDELLDPIPFDTDADLIALTCMGAGLTRALEVADQFRERGKTVVIGGPTASAHPEVVAPHVDSLVIGDGEGLIDKLLDDLENDSLQPSYKHTSPPPMTGHPVPRYDLVPPSRVGLYFPVEATRGCSIGCRFCLTTQLSGRSQRQRPIEDVVRDIEAVKAQGVNRIIFMDDNPTLDKGYFSDLTNALEPLKIRWMANATAGSVPDDATAKRLAETGCDMLAIGFETVNQASLNAIGKNCYDVSKYHALIQRLHRYGIQVTAMMVVGFDADTRESYERMLDFLVESQVEMAIFHLLTPIEGTPLYAELEEEGRILGLDLSHYTAEEAVFQPKDMSVEELNDLFWEVYGRFYSISSIAKRLVLRAPDRHLLNRLGSVAANLYMRSLVGKRRIIV
jgi:radical SAM superfamily enzyme YgiQ (UPF0313 family)